MGLESIINAVRDRLTARATAATGTYRGLVYALADGKQVKPDLVLQTLEGAGKSPEALEADVKALLRRRELQARRKELPSFARDREATEAQLAQAERELAAAQARHAQEVPPLQDRLMALELAERNIRGTFGELVAGCDDPQLLARRDTAVRRLREAQTRHHQLVQLHARTRDNPPREPRAARAWAGQDMNIIPVTPGELAADLAATQRGRSGIQPQAFDLGAALRQHAAEVARLAGEITRAEAEIRASQAEIEAVESAMAEA